MESMLGGTVAEVRADGITIRYLRAGSGSPVLLLCAALDPRFETLIGRLAESRRVIAPLESTADDETVGIVARITAFIDGLGLGPVPVVAVDMATGPAAALARLRPDRVERLVLLGEATGDTRSDATRAIAALAR